MQLKIKLLIITSFLVTTGFAQTTYQKAFNQGNTGFHAMHLRSASKMNNNSFFSAGIGNSSTMNDAYVMRTDSLSNIIWAKQYGDATFSDDEFVASKPHPDGSLVMAGSTRTGPGGTKDTYIVKIDVLGNLIWTKSFGSASFDELVDILITNSGAIYCIGSSTGGSFVVKLDAAGNMLWEKLYSSGGGSSFRGIKITPQNNLIIGGFIFEAPANKGVVIELDTNGTILWSKKYTGSSSINNLTFSDIAVLPGNEYALSGIEQNRFVAKIDQAGNLMWAKKNSFTGANSNVEQIELSLDNNAIYLTGGNLYTFPFRQATLSKFSLSGNLLWEKEYGGCNEDAFWSIIQDGNNLYLPGVTRTYGGGNTNTLIIKADTAGFTSCFDNFTNATYLPFSPTVSVLTFNVSSPNFIYANYSTTVTNITVFDSLICTSTNPVGVKFDATDTLVCLNTCASFFSDSTVMHQSYNPTTNLSYQWSFPGATFASGEDTLKNPTNVCYNAIGQFDVTLIVSDNCESDTLVKIGYITVPPNSTGIDVQNACSSLTWLDGITYTSSTNTPTFTIVGGAANGCDSLVTLNLTINASGSVNGIDNQVACNSFQWIDGNIYTTSTNTPTFTIVGGSVQGCDSIVTLNLTINSASTGTDVITSCTPITWLDANTYSTSTNTPTNTLVGAAANGCDSIVTLNLTINTAATSTDIQAVCGNSFTWIDGINYTSNTTTPAVTFIGGAANGCDSIITLNLTLTTPSKTTNVFNECEGFSITVGASTYTTTGVFTDIVNNCDTIETNLTINPAPEFSLIKNDDFCFGNSGTASVIVSNANFPLSYNWNTGAIDSTILNLSEGTYTVTVIDSKGCASTKSVNVLLIEQGCDFFVYVPNAFSPNGDGNNDNFFVNGKGLASMSFKIYNRWGNKVFETNQISQVWDGKYNGKEQSTGVFMYVLEVVFVNGKSVTESGDVSLIR